MIDVTHDRDDRVARLQILLAVLLVGIVYLLLLFRINEFHLETELLRQHGDVLGVKTLVDGDEEADAHAGGDNFGDIDVHQGGQLVGRDKLGHAQGLLILDSLQFLLLDTLMDELAFLFSALGGRGSLLGVAFETHLGLLDAAVDVLRRNLHLLGFLLLLLVLVVLEVGIAGGLHRLGHAFAFFLLLVGIAAAVVVLTVSAGLLQQRQVDGAENLGTLQGVHHRLDMLHHRLFRFGDDGCGLLLLRLRFGRFDSLCRLGLRALLLLLLTLFLLGGSFLLGLEGLEVDGAEDFGTGEMRHGLDMLGLGFGFLFGLLRSGGLWSVGGLLRNCRGFLRGFLHLLRLLLGGLFLHCAGRFLSGRFRQAFGIDGSYNLHLGSVTLCRLNGLCLRQLCGMDDDMVARDLLFGGLGGRSRLHLLLFGLGGENLVRLLLHHLVLGQLLEQTLVHVRRQLGVLRSYFKPVFRKNVDDTVIRHVKFFGRLS